MAKEKFERLRYLGPLSSFSVLTPATANKEPISKDRSLVTGATYDDLPPDHPVIQNLIAAKLLITPPPDAAPEASSEAVVTDSTIKTSGDDRSASAIIDEGKAK